MQEIRAKKLKESDEKKTYKEIVGQIDSFIKPQANACIQTDILNQAAV